MLVAVTIVALLRFSYALNTFNGNNLLLRNLGAAVRHIGLPINMMVEPRISQTLANRLPIIRDPESSTSFNFCESLDGNESGICLPVASCSLQGGRSIGACGFGAIGVCCVSEISKCSGIVTSNNTYWRTPPTGISSSTSTSCSVNVRLDQSLIKQNKFSICQLRLDFLQFTTSQPTKGVCATDSFSVSGGTNQPPVICGDNDGQHMYVHVPPSGDTPSEVQLTFTFGTGGEAISRTWNIKISMIPCGASYAAPPGCLQYLTGSSGQGQSFNWKETSETTRELVNQAYSVCFRTEIINGQRANSICYMPCQTLDGVSLFITGSSVSTTKLNKNCQTDYLVIPGIAPNFGKEVERICGGIDSLGVHLCSSVQPFSVFYKTDASEPDDDKNNLGVCGYFMQRVAKEIPPESVARNGELRRASFELSNKRLFEIVF